MDEVICFRSTLIHYLTKFQFKFLHRISISPNGTFRAHELRWCTVPAREKIRPAKFNGRYCGEINNPSLPFDFLGPTEETYSRLIAIRKFRLVNPRKSPMRPPAAWEKSAGGWRSNMGEGRDRPASPGYVYLPGVPSESNRESRRWGLIFYRRFPEFGDLGLANGQNGNATSQPAAAVAAATLRLHRITYPDIHFSLFRTTLSFCGV